MHKILLLGALMLAFSPLARAQGTSFVSEVNVEADGADSNEARTKAMASAEREGLAQLLDKLAPDQKDAIFKGLDAQHITAMVRGTEVVEEKLSTGHYRATLRLTYDASTVNALIDRKVSAVGAEDDTRTSTLIIPLFQPDEENTFLWEPNNSWRDVWDRVGVEAGSGNLIVPYGDSIDAASLDAKGAMAANYTSYINLIRRYGVRNVAILQARVKEEGKVLEVVKRMLDRTQNEVSLLTYRADPQETLEALEARAARDVADQLAHAREQVVAQRAESAGLEARQPMMATFSTMQGWMEMRKKLESIPLVKKIELQAMAPQQVDFTVSYRGTPQGLAQAITAQGIAVSVSGNYWALQGN